MKILKIEPGKKPEIMDIENSLESMQPLVGGIIQAVYPFEDPIALICNDDGKCMGLEYNRVLRHPESGVIYDVICGTMFLCGAPTDNDNFTDLTAEQLSYYSDYYKEPEIFLRTKTGIVVVKMQRGFHGSYFIQKD